MNIGFVISAGAAPCFKALELSGIGSKKAHIVSDRPCKGLEIAKMRGISNELISFTNREEFSKLAAKSFKRNNCSAAIMLFSRLVSSELYKNILTLNIHPSLLPSFKGFNAIEKAVMAKVQYQGATLHKVNEEIDGGEILAQTIFPVEPFWDIKIRKRLSYIQKTALILWFLEKNFCLEPKDNNIAQNNQNLFLNPKFKNSEYSKYFARKLLQLDPMD